MKKIAIFGAGAIGSWLAACLQHSGAAISLAARGATLDALRQNGLRIFQDGRQQHCTVKVGAACELGAQDVVIVALKAQALPGAIADLSCLLAPHTIVIAAMNGIPWWFFQNFAGPMHDVVLESTDPRGELAQLIPYSQILGCVVHASIQAVAPANLNVTAVDRLICGDPSAAASPDKLALMQFLVNALKRAAVRCDISQTVRLDIWTKLWGNMNMNPLSALTRAKTARLLDDPDVHALCVRMMEEMAECGARLGLSFDMCAEDRMAITRKLGDFKTSMLQDMESGHSLEFAAQLGAVVEIARRLTVPAPFCESVLGLTRQLSNSLAQSAGVNSANH